VIGALDQMLEARADKRSSPTPRSRNAAFRRLLIPAVRAFASLKIAVDVASDCLPMSPQRRGTSAASWYQCSTSVHLTAAARYAEVHSVAKPRFAHLAPRRMICYFLYGLTVLLGFAQSRKGNVRSARLTSMSNASSSKVVGASNAGGGQ